MLKNVVLGLKVDEKIMATAKVQSGGKINIEKKKSREEAETD